MKKKPIIRKPIVKPKTADIEEAIDKFVGKSPDAPTVQPQMEEVEEKRLSLRIPKPLADAVERARKPPQSIVKKTANAWIAEAIAEKLERENG